MRIERVDDKTVKCFLSNEELEQYDIDYKDFVMRNEKAKEVVQEIIQQAAEEVGYKPPRFAFDLQIMMLPDQGLLLTFSEREPDGDQLMECLKEMKRVLQMAKENVSQIGQNQKQESSTPQKSEKQGKRGKSQPVPQPEFAVFAFSKIQNVMNFASSLPANLRVESALYEMNGIYYLFFEKGHASYTRYSRACIQALEFAALYTANEKQTVQLKEHGTCLIAEKAVKKLRV